MDNLKELYTNSNAERAVFFGRIIFLFILTTLPFFIYLDIFVLGLNRGIIYLRILPLVITSIFLIFTFIIKKKTGYFFIVMYAVVLMSNIVMMLGLVYIVMHTSYFHDSIIATIIVILLIAIGSVKGMIFLIPVYVVPFAGFLTFIVIEGNIELNNVVALSNPIILAAGFIILAEIAERSRFKNFVSMKTIELQTEELKKKNRLIEDKNSIFEKELSLARLVQKSLLPVSAPSFSSINTSVIFNPMREVGGDLYDFVYFSNNEKIGIFISDISGHGISAAIMSSMVKTLLVTAGARRLSPSHLLSYLNINLTGMLSDNFLTAFYGIYDPQLRTFTYARGGHEYPLLITPDKELVQLKSCGKLIGFKTDIEFEECTVKLNKGDKILLFTDGLTEAVNDSGIMFEETMFNNIIPAISSEPVELFVSRLYSELIDFKKKRTLEDDMCIIGVEILK